MDKIVFLHMNQLGDLIFSLPVLKAAQEELNSKIYSVVKPGLAPLLEVSELVDGIIPKERSFINLIKSLKKGDFDKAVLFSESPNSLLVAYLSGIPEIVGFKTASLNFLLTQKAKRIGVPSVFNNRELGKTIGLENIRSEYTGILRVPEENLNEVEKWFTDNNIDIKKAIAISIGASKKRKDKCLKAEIWTEVIDALAEKGFSCVLSGASWEKESMSKLSSKCKSKPKIYSAYGGILDSAAFLKKCSLFVGIDSGPMHLAAALGTRCIGVFGHTDPKQIGPMPLNKHIIIKKDSVLDITAKDIISKIIR